LPIFSYMVSAGGRYDQVTDAVIASYLGIEPPHFAVASLTLLLPLGGHEVTDNEIASAEQRLNRLRHNPDQLLGEIEFDTAEDRHHALALADEKRRLVEAIAHEGADKKTIGRRIREINEELAMLMSPLAEQAAADVERLRAQRETAEVLRDRSYPVLPVGSARGGRQGAMTIVVSAGIPASHGHVLSVYHEPSPAAHGTDDRERT